MQIYQNIKLNENGLCSDAQDHEVCDLMMPMHSFSHLR